MEVNEQLTVVMNDLIEIHNDRFTGYKKAAEKSKDLDTDLQTIFNNIANDSRRYAAELMEEIYKSSGIPSKGSIRKGKIYRAWINIGANFSGSDRQAILESCEFAEDSIQKAYNGALASDAQMDNRTRIIITNQKAYLKTAHKLVKNYRDAHWKNDGVITGFLF